MVQLSRRRLLIGLALASLLVLAGVLSVQAAERRAATAEATHVSEQLGEASCLTDWGTNEGTVRREVSVTGLTLQGLRISVRLPYATTTETDEGSLHADTVSEAAYLVTPGETRRVSGDEIAPC